MFRYIRKHTRLLSTDLSLRISFTIVIAMFFLLMASLLIMHHYAKKTIREDALHRASNMLETSLVHIDNILLSVEETAGNTFFLLLNDLDKPEKMYTYSRKIVESNPYVTGCAIVFKPGFYPDRKDFMAYFYRPDSKEGIYGNMYIEQAFHFGDRPYTDQVWYIKPMNSRRALWLNPLEGMKSDIEPLTSFCLPISTDGGEPIGVIAVDVSLRMLSDIIANSKPSPNSYCALLDQDGSIIVDPVGDHLLQQNAFRVANNSLHEAVEAMVSGKTGYLPFTIYGRDYFVFFKPFQRAYVPNRVMDDMGWSVGIAYSQDDVFGGYRTLLYYVHGIATVGMIFIFFFSWMIIKVRLRPLKLLSDKAKRIAKGHYNEPIPLNHHKDEIGSLQRNFQLMQQSLASNMGELQKLNDTIQKRSEELDVAYKQAKQADRMKTVFLHNMTNQMVEPAFAIDEDVAALSNMDGSMSKERNSELVDNIQENAKTITKALNNMLTLSEEEMRKEVEHA